MFKPAIVATIFGSLAAVSAIAAPANYQCTYTVECLEGEACQATRFSLSFAAPEKSSDLKTTIVTDAETIEGTAVQSEDGTVKGFMAARSNGDLHMGSVAADGTARYSVHMPTSEISISYLGKCEIEQ